MAEETLKYRVQLDDSDLNSQLNNVKMRIDQAIQEAFSGASLQQATTMSPVSAPLPTMTGDPNITNYGAPTSHLPFYSYIPQAGQQMLSDVNETVTSAFMGAGKFHDDISGAFGRIGESWQQHTSGINIVGQ